jgi:hypothetical protein
MLKALTMLILLGLGVYVVKLFLPDLQRYLAIRSM